MKTVHRKSLIPIYCIPIIWLAWALFLPLYRTSDFLILAALSCGAYFALNKIFPGHDEQVEEPPLSTGDDELDALLQKGHDACREYAELTASIKNKDICAKAAELSELTAKIFGDLKEHPAGKSQVKRFSDYFVPAPIKLLKAYRNLEAQGVEGDNISGAMERISGILDTTAAAYKKEIDALFEGRVIDIETDIEVLEAMLKREGLAGSDF